MLSFFNRLSTTRTGWLLVLVSALGLELIALYFQYGLGLLPCVLCIYERLAVLGIFFAGIIGLISPRALVMRLLALLCGLGSAIKGLIITVQHLDLQMNPAPWKQCEIVPNFPETLPLHQWFPFIFNPTGSCGVSQWSLFGLTMVQWLVVIFSVYTLLFVLALVAQCKKSKTQRRLFSYRK